MMGLHVEREETVRGGVVGFQFEAFRSTVLGTKVTICWCLPGGCLSLKAETTCRDPRQLRSSRCPPYSPLYDSSCRASHPRHAAGVRGTMGSTVCSHLNDRGSTVGPRSYDNHYMCPARAKREAQSEDIIVIPGQISVNQLPLIPDVDRPRAPRTYILFRLRDQYEHIYMSTVFATN